MNATVASPTPVTTRIEPAPVPTGMNVVIRVSVTARTSPATGPAALGKNTRLFVGMIQSNPRPTSRTSPPGIAGEGSSEPIDGATVLAVKAAPRHTGSAAAPVPSATAGAIPLGSTSIRSLPVGAASQRAEGLHAARPVTPVSSVRPGTWSAPPATNASAPPAPCAGKLAEPPARVERAVPSALTRSMLPPPTARCALSGIHTGAVPAGPWVGLLPFRFVNHTRPARSTASFVPSGKTDGKLPSVTAVPPTNTRPPSVHASGLPPGPYVGLAADEAPGVRSLAVPPAAARRRTCPPWTYATSPATT